MRKRRWKFFVEYGAAHANEAYESETEQEALDLCKEDYPGSFVTAMGECLSRADEAAWLGQDLATHG